MIYVTKSFLPPIEEYEEKLKGIWDSCYMTNYGPLLREFEAEMKKRLSVKNFQFVTNGTLALQIALHALDIDGGEVITTPFSYVATTSSILWERCEPVFVDIEPDNFTIDPNKIEAAITPRTKAIMPVHVFGYACDIDRIRKIADKHNLKVIYDAAHAFGSVYKGKSLCSFGDISMLSFHATKLFHTIEGGAVVVNNDNVDQKFDLSKRFGHFEGDDHRQLGINAKASEFQAAMGLCNLKYVDEIIAQRKQVSEWYDKYLEGAVGRPKEQKDLQYNYAYYPILLKDENQLFKVIPALKEAGALARRYFWPSLNNLPYLKEKQSCPVSENISSRVLSIPLYPDLPEDDVKCISETIREIVHV